MEIELVEEYSLWLKERVNGNGMSRANFPMGRTHNRIAKALDSSRLSFDEVVTLFAGIVASRYCDGGVDARSAIGLFAYKLLQHVGVKDDDNDEYDEIVDRVDACDW